MEGCQWIVGQGVHCNAITVEDGEHCYFHQKLAECGLKPQIPGSTFAHTSSMSNRHKDWKQELDADFEATKKQIKRGKNKTLHLKKSDFPCLVDGLPFESLEEYVGWVSDGGLNFLEMPGTDQQYDELKRNPGKFHGNSGSYKQNQLFGYSSSYTPPPPKPAYTLQLNHYGVVGEVKHMRYVVYRSEEGDYYAIWVSLFPNAELQTAMSSIVAEPLKPLIGQVKTVDGVCNFHLQGGHKTFSRAEDWFYHGVETLGRIKERIKKAEDPDWMPPNLRQLALIAFNHPEVWKAIPEGRQPRLKQWLNDGAPGWFKEKPKGVRRGCMEPGRERQQPLMLSAPKDKPVPEEPKSTLKQVWDNVLKRWIHN